MLISNVVVSKVCTNIRNNAIVLADFAEARSVKAGISVVEDSVNAYATELDDLFQPEVTTVSATTLILTINNL